MPRPENPVHFIDDKDEFDNLCVTLLSESVLALDVETTIEKNPELCTIQFGNETTNWVIDVLKVKDISSVAPVLASEDVVKFCTKLKNTSTDDANIK